MTGRTLAEERQQYRERETRKYAAAHPSDVTPPRTHVNNTTSGLYSGGGMTPARAGADDHKQHGSLGLGVQIIVRTV